MRVAESPTGSGTRLEDIGRDVVQENLSVFADISSWSELLSGDLEDDVPAGVGSERFQSCEDVGKSWPVCGHYLPTSLQ